MFVKAESGLLCRSIPNGKVIHKFEYGMEIEILETTNQELTINDEGKEITGNWVKVKITNSNKTGYVFDGFLTPEAYFDLDVEKIAKLTPAQFVNTSNPNGLLLNGNHNIYNNDLQIIGQLSIDSISEIKILSGTKFERPITRNKHRRKQWQEYCEWAKYLKVIYNNKELILFGKNVLSITKSTPILFNNENINFIRARNFLKKSNTLTEELSECYSGSYPIINNNNTYYFIQNFNLKEKSYLSFEDSEYGTDIDNASLNKDTISYKRITCDFGTGFEEYDLKIFKNKNKWFYDISNYNKTYTD